MDALEIKEVAGLRAELDERATTQYVDGSDAALQLQIDQVESDLTDLENEVAVHELRLDNLEARPVSDVTKSYVDTQDAALQAQINNRALLEHGHTSGQIADFIEAVQDTVAQMLRGVNVSYNYDDAAGTVTITASPATPFDPEQTRDIIGAALRPLGLISIGVKDEGDTITISTTATQNSTDAELRRRDLHTGTQGMDTVEGLAATLANKTNNATTAALSGRVATLEQVLQADELVEAKRAEWTGLTPRAALLKLINEGITGGGTPTPQPETLTITNVFAS